MMGSIVKKLPNVAESLNIFSDIYMPLCLIDWPAMTPLPAHINLRQVVFGGGAEMDRHVEAGVVEDLGNIDAELGEDRVAPVAAGVGDPGRPVLDRPIGAKDSTRIGLLDAR